MVNITCVFHSPSKSYTIAVEYNTLIVCIRYSGTRGVMRHFDFMRNRTLRIVNLEKLFAAKRIRLNEYVAIQIVRHILI